MSFSFSPKIITEGLVLYLDAANTRSYVSGSTTWNDISRVGNNGTLTNGPTFNLGNGGSIVFDGVDDYTNLGNILNFEYNNSFTVDGWFYFNSDVDGALISKQDDTANYRGWILRKFSSYQIMFGLVNTPSLQVQVRGPLSSMVVNTWYYICATYNGSTLASGLNLYLNGSQLSTTVASNTLGNNTIITSATAKVGAFGSSIINNPLNGRNSISKVYNRALSASEILQNYNTTKTRFGL